MIHLSTLVMASACFFSTLVCPAPVQNGSLLVKRQSTSSQVFSWPNTVTAPYCDVLLWPTFDVNVAAQATGNKFFTLAFIQSDQNGNAAWGGVVSLSDNFYADKIQSLKDLGGNVIISFGGAIGTELASYHQDVNTITTRYQSVINTYGVSWVDFDIEGSAIADTNANTRRAKAIVALKKSFPNLVVSYTLPVMPNGLTADGVNLLKNAVANGLQIDVVNIMAMDYGPSSAPNGAFGMGGYAISAAQAAYQQARAAGLPNFKMGITPMIGVNDVAGQIFRPEDAQQLLSFAQSTPWVRWIGYWSINRDTDIIGPLFASSQIVQTRFQFLNTFKGFSGARGGALPSLPPATGPSTVPPVTPDSNVNVGYRWPSKTFAPFIDATSWPTFDIVSMSNRAGTVNYALGFIVSGSNNAPSWGGYYDMSASWYTASIANIRRFGGDVIISFGGAAGKELALTNNDPTRLQNHYQNVVDSYSIGWVDFDVEGIALSDRASIDRRSKAIRGLQEANPNLIVSFTLPVLTTGLMGDGLYVLQSAKAAGVRVDVVNIMTMNFGAGNGASMMGDYTIAAATATNNQVKQLGMTTTKIGLTPMIGQNDILSEFFTLSDARKVIAWANQQSWVSFVSFWSANRDNSKQSSDLGVSTNVPQRDWEFSSIFMQFAN